MMILLQLLQLVKLKGDQQTLSLYKYLKAKVFSNTIMFNTNCVQIVSIINTIARIMKFWFIEKNMNNNVLIYWKNIRSTNK